jgi:hypothetical protein
MKEPGIFRSQPNDKASFLMRKKADCYQQKFIKYPGVGTFHSLSELLHSALLESDPLVTSFTPQPDFGKINGKKYIPDSGFIRDGEKWIVELKPRGEFTDSKRIPLEEHAKQKGYRFAVVSNEEVLEQKIKADNWLRITRALVAAEFIDTTGEEEVLTERLSLESNLTFGNFVDPLNRIAKYHWEIALFRLAHFGSITLDLHHRALNLHTRVRLCD